MATRSPARGAARDRGLPHTTYLAQQSWAPLPHVLLLTGEADFFKEAIVKRFVAERFGSAPPELTRFQGAPQDRGAPAATLAQVLDELRTPSFFSPYRIIVLEHAGPFLVEHADDLIPFLDSGFVGGHLLALVDGKLDGRTKIARAATERGLVVDCAQPYDRPPPWDTRTPVWDSELTRWVVSHAATKGLQVDAQTAFAIHERAGTDLGVIDEELQKIATYLVSRGSTRIDAAAVEAVIGDLREDSIFHAVELFLEGRRGEALQAVVRLFEKGHRNEKGAVATEPTAIALYFIGTLLPRLRTLRRAHAMAAEGAGPDEWLAAGLVQRPFLPRLQRELAAVPPRKLVRLLDRLYEVDRRIKAGGDSRTLLEMLVVEMGGK
jgi:DNA polymerase III delta subunit